MTHNTAGDPTTTAPTPDSTPVVITDRMITADTDSFGALIADWDRYGGKNPDDVDDMAAWHRTLVHLVGRAAQENAPCWVVHLPAGTAMREMDLIPVHRYTGQPLNARAGLALLVLTADRLHVADVLWADQLAGISGLGAAKLEKYGDALLGVTAG